MAREIMNFNNPKVTFTNVPPSSIRLRGYEGIQTNLRTGQHYGVLNVRTTNPVIPVVSQTTIARIANMQVSNGQSTFSDIASKVSGGGI